MRFIEKTLSMIAIPVAGPTGQGRPVRVTGGGMLQAGACNHLCQTRILLTLLDGSAQLVERLLVFASNSLHEAGFASHPCARCLQRCAASCQISHRFLDRLLELFALHLRSCLVLDGFDGCLTDRGLLAFVSVLLPVLPGSLGLACSLRIRALGDRIGPSRVELKTPGPYPQTVLRLPLLARPLQS